MGATRLGRRGGQDPYTPEGPVQLHAGGERSKPATRSPAEKDPFPVSLRTHGHYQVRGIHPE